MTNCVKYWLKLTRMGDHRYPKHCYLMLKRLHESGRKTWAGNIKEMLFQFGFGYVWISHDVGDDLNFINMFKQRLFDCYSQNWHNAVDSSPKALHYKYFKTLLNVERYLSLDLAYKYRRAFSNFRCSCHNLMIEKGRHIGIDRDLRYCFHCLKTNIYVIEDEYHFFFECSLYNNIRAVYFKDTWLHHHSHHLFYSLMSSTIINEVISIAKYIYYAMNVRKEELNTV